MSELAGIAGSPGQGKNGASRPSKGPVAVYSQAPTGMRTPTDIMRQRRDREARKQAEQEAREREQEELERRRQQDELRAQQAHAHAHAQAQAQSQQYAAGVAGGTPQRRPATSRVPPSQDMTTDTGPGGTGVPIAHRFDASGSVAARDEQVSTRPHVVENGGLHAQTRPMPTSSSPQHASPQNPPPPSNVPGTTSVPGAQAATTTYQKPNPQTAPPTGQAGFSQSQQTQPRRTGFPHAFERWETLSSHWEGLTGYWIRKMEQNNEALERDPLSQQMARQITDLSAAGANLFHAVVELQRLRASSERKFQRWFFDTRAEQERAKELQADLERQLNAERQSRAEAFASMQKAEADRTRAQDLLKEMRRELKISKEEARRAWEELGRREQEERDRTNSLRNGEPTLVGGVQVVPMIQGLSGRTNTANRPPTREGPYPGGPGTTSMGGMSEGDHPSTRATEAGTARQYYDRRTASPTESDPFTEGARPLHHEPDVSSFNVAPQRHPTVTSASEQAGRFYQLEATGLYAGAPVSEPDDQSYGPSVVSSEAGDEEYHRQYHHDPHGDQGVLPPAAPEVSGDYGHGQAPADDDVRRAHEYGSAPVSSAPLYADYSQAGGADYSGAGWGVGTGWEAMTPRHRHPTRLSDVLEEDEPSRTTPSRASQASRGIQ